MKKWRIPLAFALLAALFLVINAPHGPGLLRDSDTVAILRGIQARHSALSWFTTDWPLENHFYRPIPTLLFELDHFLYGSNQLGYGITNSFLCAFTLLGLAWLVRELTDSPAYTLACTLLFLVWSFDNGPSLESACYWLCLIPILGGLWRHGFMVRHWIGAPFVVFFFAEQLRGMEEIQSRSLDWLPGRTATTMAVFCLVALASYARWERLTAGRAEPRITSQDRPAASRTASDKSSNTSFGWVWITICGVATLLSLASYEQAIMLPACFVTIAVYFRLQRIKARLWPHLVAWLLLPLYMLLRKATIPSGISGYQNQQLRFSPTVYTALERYFVPDWPPFQVAIDSLKFGPEMLLQPVVYLGLIGFAGMIITAIYARRDWPLLVAGLCLAGFAYLPMAWLKFFSHYHYWPLALHTIFVVTVGHIAWKAVSTAVCPPVLQAPLRPSPAPGSLPHR